MTGPVHPVTDGADPRGSPSAPDDANETPATPASDPTAETWDAAPAAEARDTASLGEGPGRLAAGVCPYLEIAGGRWRQAVPSRDHRCTAIRPPAPLSIDKQRRLCLGVAHVTCPAFLAAAEARRAWPGVPAAVGTARDVAPPEAFANRWAVTRIAPVVARPPRPGLALRSGRQQRVIAQAGLVGILVLAFAAIAVARFPGDDGSSALLAATPSPLPTPTLAPTPTFTPSPSPTIEITPEPTVEPTQPPTPSPVPTAATISYRVVSGDTLSGIASRYRTTVKAIMDLNKLTTTNLRVGQILLIPAPPA
jgi:LysM repeat protein